jgi:hypothetical protein
MKIKSFFLISLAFSISGCAITPPGPSVASQGPGSDTAYINSGRGRSDAQITKDQADQYDRQRQQVKGEMDLEQAKRDQSTKNIKDTISTIGAARSLLPF